MIEHWERSRVRGYNEEEKKEHFEEVLHRRGEDPLVMACRRNQGLAGCGRIRTYTEEAFIQIREDAEGSRRRKDIPRDDRQGDRFEW